jgi:hypothetical protein
MKRPKHRRFRHAATILAAILIGWPAFAAPARIALSVTATVVRPCTLSSDGARPAAPAPCGGWSPPAFSLSSSPVPAPANGASAPAPAAAPSAKIVYATFTY